MTCVGSPNGEKLASLARKFDLHQSEPASLRTSVSQSKRVHVLAKRFNLPLLPFTCVLVRPELKLLADLPLVAVKQLQKLCYFDCSDASLSPSQAFG